MSPNVPELASYCNRSGIRAHQSQGNAGTIFCNHVDCGVIADSRQSHRNPVATCHDSIFRPMAPTNHCQFLTQSNRSCHNRDLRFLQSRGLRLNSGFQAILGQLRRIARILVWGSSAILSTPRNPRNCLFRLFAILPQSRNSILQSCGLWIDCIFKAILIQFGWIASGVAIKCQQLSQDCPTIAIREESDCNPP